MGDLQPHGNYRTILYQAGSEKRDVDFTWREFDNNPNGELLGAWGNFVNRTLAFVYKYFDATIPDGELDSAIETKTSGLYATIGKLIEDGNLKEALDTAFEFVRFGNKYFDSERPWETRNADTTVCVDAIYNCVQMIANLAVLLDPFLPFSSAKVRQWLSIDDGWFIKRIPAGLVISEPEILFERLDKSVVDEELERLQRW